MIDSGAGYSWWRRGVVRGWLAAHPDWLRATGAVGPSNQAMIDQAFEQQGTVVRVPNMALGPLQLHDVGLLGSGPAEGGIVGPVIGSLFWNAWEKGALDPVVGWMGGNVLCRYRITIDYRNHVTYWLQATPPSVGALDSVGLSLVHTPTQYQVGGLVRRDGVAPVAGVEVGDVLLSMDGRAASPMTRDGILQALGGQPGEHHRLSLERNGRRIDLDLPVNAY